MFKSKSPFIVVDPKGELEDILKIMGGEVITLKPGKSTTINPFDINFDNELNFKKIKIDKEDILFDIKKNNMEKEEILKEKIVNEVKDSLKEEKIFLLEEEYLSVFYKELKEIISFYDNVEFNEKENYLIFKI